MDYNVKNALICSFFKPHIPTIVKSIENHCNMLINNYKMYVQNDFVLIMCIVGYKNVEENKIK